MERIKWEEYFMAQSHLLALRSTCQRLSVGATIVKDNRIIAGGYNGSVAGEVHCIDEGCLIEDGHCIRTIHAEMNALLQCAKQGVSTEGATIYVTHFPCLNCKSQLFKQVLQQFIMLKIIITMNMQYVYWINLVLHTKRFHFLLNM